MRTFLAMRGVARRGRSERCNGHAMTLDELVFCQSTRDSREGRMPATVPVALKRLVVSHGRLRLSASPVSPRELLKKTCGAEGERSVSALVAS